MKHLKNWILAALLGVTTAHYRKLGNLQYPL